MAKPEIDNLLLQLQQGDEVAFEKIYTETERALFSYILSLCRNYHTAEDLLQTTYIRLRTTISNYKVGANGYAWLYTIAKNATLNEMKRQKRESLTDVEEHVSKFGSYEMQEESSLTSLMNRILNDNEREIVTLHISGFRHREIAEIMEKPMGTILWTYNNALAKLKRALQREGEDEV